MSFSPGLARAREQHDAHHASTFQRLRAGTRNPEVWLVVVSVAAWAFLAAQWFSRPGHGAQRGPASDVAAVAAMVIAMMLPLTIGHVREAAGPDAPPLRVRAAAVFAAAFVAAWMLVMVAIETAVRSTASAAGWTMAAGGAIAAAVLCEMTPGRWRRWRRRGDGPTPPTAGGRPMAGAAWLGVAAAGHCAASCWALMAACVAFAHSLPLMAAVFAIQLHGRYRRPACPAITALAVLGVGLVSLALARAGHPHHQV